jgi:hypothetical protein
MKFLPSLLGLMLALTFSSIHRLPTRQMLCHLHSPHLRLQNLVWSLKPQLQQLQQQRLMAQRLS